MVVPGSFSLRNNLAPQCGAFLLCMAVWVSGATAADLHVPADQPTIQQAINIAAHGDRVLVSPGTYYEHISFLGKRLEVIGIDGAATTILDGSNTGTVVAFTHQERGAVLQGFTIRHGYSVSPYSGGGVTVSRGAMPTIEDNVFEDNLSGAGGAINVDQGSPRIQGNQFRHNDCTYEGGAIYLYGRIESHATRIEDNVFEFNGSEQCIAGGGIYARRSGSLQIKRNVIRNNVVNNLGGGIYLEHGQALIADNLIHDNRAPVRGGGVILFVGYQHNSANLVNNTLAGNTIDYLYIVAAPGGTFSASNNIIVTTHNGISIHCEKGKRGSAVFSHNLLFSPLGAKPEGDCDLSGGGLLTSDPKFVGGDDGQNRHAYWLLPGSPAIDAGDDTSVRQKTDLRGVSRIQGQAVDLGAFEFRVN